MSYALVATPGGASVRSLADGETFHPIAGPSAEANALYVRQLDLVARARSAATADREFVIWDVGLGAGGNICTVLRALTDCPATLRIVSFECTLAPLRFALGHAAELPFLAGFEATLEELTRVGHVTLDDRHWHGSWALEVEDFPTRIADSHRALPAPDAILFDAFSPRKNPAMWSAAVFGAMRARLAPNRPANLATFSRATLVRTALLLSGWYVGRGDALEGKEETTVAASHRELLPNPLGPEFIHRVERSDAAEPLDGNEYRQRKMEPHSVERLRTLPQFAIH